LLYSITKDQSLNNLTFDLFWGFPRGMRDYLDGTCMLYKDKLFYKTVDYHLTCHDDLKDLTHSGDIIDNINRKGKESKKKKSKLFL
jgi:hypothetical protein